MNPESGVASLEMARRLEQRLMDLSVYGMYIEKDGKRINPEKLFKRPKKERKRKRNP